MGLGRRAPQRQLRGCPGRRQVRARQGLCQGLSDAHSVGLASARLLRAPGPPAAGLGGCAGLGVGGAQGPEAEGLRGGQPACLPASWAALACALGEAGEGRGDWLPLSGDHAPGIAPPDQGLALRVLREAGWLCWWDASPAGSLGYAWRSEARASRSEHSRECVLCCFCVCVCVCVVCVSSMCVSVCCLCVCVCFSVCYLCV